MVDVNCTLNSKRRFCAPKPDLQEAPEHSGLPHLPSPEAQVEAFSLPLRVKLESLAAPASVGLLDLR